MKNYSAFKKYVTVDMASNVSSRRRCFFFAVVVLSIFAATPSMSQPQAADSCNGIFLSYTYTGGSRLSPNVSDTAEQPYRFESTLRVLNNGLEELKSWRVFVGFRHREWLVSATNAVLDDGKSIPGDVGNGTVFAGSSVRDLKTAAATAGDLGQMEVRVEMVGTVYGVAPPSVPMPSTINLANDGFLCGEPSSQGINGTSEYEIPITTWSLQGVLDSLKNIYGNFPIFIHENGQQTPRNSSLDDWSRVKYLHEYIRSMVNALRNGSNVKGYFVWSFLDAFELLSGYELSYGLYYIDMKDPSLKRQSKLSAEWYSKFLKRKPMDPKFTMEIENNAPLLSHPPLLYNAA